MWTSEAATKRAAWVAPLLMMASTSAGSVRPAARIFARRPASAIRRTLAASSGLTTGIPPLITETPTSESFSAMRSFSSGVKWTPGICSPSRRVSSQKRMRSGRERPLRVSAW